MQLVFDRLNSLGYVTSIYGEPRMYGASLRVNFGE